MDRCPIGIIGWGTVGGGVLDVLARDRELIGERCGLDIRVKTIVTRTPSRARDQQAAGAAVGSDPQAILGDPEIRVAVLLVGGTADAKDLCLRLIAAGTHVVTANKALLAEHGDEIFGAAAERGVGVAFEAAVAGGIPIIAALRDGLVANRIEAIYGILNGTCNFILTKMEVEGLGYREALAEAQRLGYAEADPTLDVDGTDTAHKLALLARIAFNARIPVTKVRVEGIQGLGHLDIRSAKTMGARIKLLAAARQRPEGLELRVAPTLVPLDHPLADVSRTYNGIYVVGSAAGPNLLVGQGAGPLPTASAVLADVVDVATGRYQHTAAQFAFFRGGREIAFLPESEEHTGSYARFVVPDKPGILAGITQRLSNHGVSVLSIHQGEPQAGTRAMIEIVTHPLRGGSFLSAVADIDRNGLTLEPTVCLRRL
jgi:homoserine dehydrogenase